MARTKAAPAVAPASEPVSAPSGEIENQTPPIESAAIEAAAQPAAAAPEPAPEPVERPISARDKMMAEIVANRNAVLEKELAEGRAQGGEPEPEPAAPRQDALNTPAAPRAAPEPSPAPAPAAADGTGATVTDPPRIHKITVRGRQLDMPEDHLLQAAAAGIDAQATLAEARRIYDEAQRLRGSAQDPSAGHSSPPAATPAPSSQPPSGIAEDEVREAVRLFQYGDETEGAAALHRLLERAQAQQPTVDMRAIAEQVRGEVMQGLQLRQDLTTIGTEYADIINDPRLAAIAGEDARQLRDWYVQGGVVKSEIDVFREAADRTRQYVKDLVAVHSQAQPQPEPPAPTPAPASPSGDSARTIIKRSTPNAPAAAGAIPMTPAPQAMSPKDIVNWMRSKRPGQSALT